VVVENQPGADGIAALDNLVAEGERTEHYFDYIGADPTHESAGKVVESLSPEQRQRVRSILLKTR
jgi:hypothetical protein